MSNTKRSHPFSYKKDEAVRLLSSYPEGTKPIMVPPSNLTDHTEKECPRCERVLPLDEHYHVKPGGNTRKLYISSYCKECTEATKSRNPSYNSKRPKVYTAPIERISNPTTQSLTLGPYRVKTPGSSCHCGRKTRILNTYSDTIEVECSFGHLSYTFRPNGNMAAS